MKNRLYIFFLLFTIASAGWSQNSNCGAASAFCSGTTTYPASTNAGTAQSGPNYGCLYSQPNPAWFYMQVATSGNIALTITSNPARDIDFILYGPFTSPTAPCNGQLTAANTEDCSYAGGTAPEIADITGGIAGEYYLLLLTNYSNQATTISFSQTSGSGSTSCAVLCSITGLTATPTTCSPATNTYSLSGQVTFNTQPTTGTLTVSSSCGGSQTFNAPFTSPINYNITGITSNGAACNVTATFSATPSCTRTTPYTSPANCTPCTASAGSNSPVCSGNSLNLTAGTVSGATTYSWTGPNGFSSTSQNPVITNASTAASGTYTVTVTTSSATCSATTTATVKPTPTTPSATSNAPVCSGNTLDLTTPFVSGATFSWTGPGGYTSANQNPSIPSVTNASTGTYSVTVTVNGCTSSAGTVPVIINNTPGAPTPNINGSTTPAPVCAGSTLTLTANNIAGTYSWAGPNGYTAAVRNPPPIVNATPAMSGTYSVTITTSAGCTSLPGTVSIVVNAVPVAPTAAGATVCFGGSATLTATSPGGTYDWYDAASGGTLVANGSSFTTPSLTATTTYYVQSTSNGCTGPRTAVTVTVSPSFTVVSTPDDSICSGASATIGVISPVGTYTYSWDEPGSAGFSTLSNPVVSPATTTTYTVTLSDQNGCSGIDMVTITVGSPLMINAGGLPTSCAAACDGSAGVLASGSFPPYTYSWSTGAATNMITGLCAGVDSITVTDLIGCSAADSVVIQEPSPLTLSATSITSHCNLPDGSAMVTANGGTPGYTYSWLPGNQSTATATNLTPGTYTVTVNDSHNCQVTATTTVANAAGVTASLTGSTNITCNGMCNGTVSTTATGGTLPYNYSWNSGQTTPNLTGICAGNYTMTVTDSAGCTSVVNVTVTQPPAVFVDAFAPPGPTICIGQNATLTASAIGGTAPYTFNWTPSFTGNPNIVSPTTPGVTTYSVSATDANGCASQNTQTTQVTVRPPLNVVASNDEIICEGGSIVLSAAGNGGDQTYNYSWAPGGTSSTLSSFNVSPLVTTTYTVTLTDGCTTTPATDVVTITVKPLPIVNFSASALSGCAPLCVNFTDLSSSNVVGWNWTIDGTTYNSQNPTHCFTTAGTYSITLSDTSNFQCESSLTQSNMITVHSMPEPEFTYDPQPASINYPEIHFSDQSLNVSAWSWNFGDTLNLVENSSNASSPYHTYSDVGEYCVKLTAYNTPACVDSVTHCLIIQPDYTLYIPNAFTPNGSGLNDEFVVKGENIQLFDMQIYNRWGNLVYHTDDINKHWNGSYNNGTEVAQADVYVYVINIKDKVGERHQYIGHVTIVK